MKKGSLSLSVNAIVIFVLAFAMLGFGLFIIQKLQGQADSWTDKAFDIKDLGTQPSSSDPIVFSEQLKLTKGKKLDVILGVYNSDIEDLGGKVEIINCINAEADEFSGSQMKINIVMLPVILEPSDSYAFAATINPEDPIAGTYVCNIGYPNTNVIKQFNVEVKA